MIGEDLQKFSGSRVMRTSAIGRVPIRNLPKKKRKKPVIFGYIMYSLKKNPMLKILFFFLSFWKYFEASKQNKLNIRLTVISSVPSLLFSG